MVSIILKVAWVRVTAIANASASTEEVVRIDALGMRGFLEAAPACHHSLVIWVTGHILVMQQNKIKGPSFFIAVKWCLSNGMDCFCCGFRIPKTVLLKTL